MFGKSIVSHFARFQWQFRRAQRQRPDLHTVWAQHPRLPAGVQASPLAQRCLELLGPLAWDRLPERNLARHWGQPTVPYAAFIAACLIKLHEGRESFTALRVLLAENPALVWLLGFPLLVSIPAPGGCDADASLPTARHLTRMLRELPNPVLQFLLADSVRLIREELAALGVPTGACIALDTKHILAWVKQNNPKAYVSDRFDKTRQPKGDPDCRLGCKRRHNRRQPGSEPGTPSTPTTYPLPAREQSVGEFYWGYGSGIVVTRAPGWGEFVLAELTQTFDQPDISYFFPLMTLTEQRLGFRPRWGAFDAAFDAWYVYAYFHRDDDPEAFAAVPFAEKGGYKGRRFSPEGLPLCAAGLPMPLRFTFTDRTTCLRQHERGKYVCPLRYPQPRAQACPVNHPSWRNQGCTAMMPTSIGARLRYQLDRDSDAYKHVYNQRSANERINSQAVALGIERPHLRNGAAIANQNTLIYLLINLRLLQRIRHRLPEIA